MFDSERVLSVVRKVIPLSYLIVACFMLYVTMKLLGTEVSSKFSMFDKIATTCISVGLLGFNTYFFAHDVKNVWLKKD